MYTHVEPFVAGDMFVSYHLLDEDIVTSDGEIEYLILFDLFD